MDSRRAKVNHNVIAHDDEESDEENEVPPPLLRLEEVEDDNDVPELLDSDGRIVQEVREATVMATACEGFTPRQVLRARKARKMMHGLSAPSYKDIKEALSKVIRDYNVNDVAVETVHADNEFRPIEQEIRRASRVRFVDG